MSTDIKQTDRWEDIKAVAIRIRERAGMETGALVNPEQLPLKDSVSFYGNRLGNEAVATVFIRENEEPGFIGWFDSDPDEQAAIAVLDEACMWIQKKQKNRAVGPMDGVTWGNYRFLMDEGPAIFRGEPSHPDWYPEYWRKAGFHTEHQYISKIFPVNTDAPKAENKNPDFEFIHITKAQVEGYMDDLREMTNYCFGINPYFTPMPTEWFNPSYRQIVDSLPEGFIRLAVDKSGKPVGFILTYPYQPDLNLNDPLNHQPRLVLKTLAVDPSIQKKGLGTALVNEAWNIAREHRIPWMIYALMHSGNPSTRISPELTPHLKRQYELLKKDLE